VTASVTASTPNLAVHADLTQEAGHHIDLNEADDQVDLNKEADHLNEIAGPEYFDNVIVPNERCGLTNFDPSLDPTELLDSFQPQGRIVNGEVVSASLPWMVGIYRKMNGATIEFRCSGALINERFVLTSAYCVSGLSKSQIAVSVGSTKLQTNISSMILVDAVKMHEYFSAEFRNNDIALVKLKRNVIYSSEINSICLPATNNVETVLNKNLIVAGW
jgi:hypothetical protein